MIQKSLIILTLALLLPLPAWSALTFGVVPRQDSLIRTEQQALQFAKALQNNLDEEVKVRIFPDEATLHAWMNRYQLVDIAVLPRNYVKTQPAGEFFHLIGGGAFGSLDSIVTRQGMVRRQAQKIQRAMATMTNDSATRSIFQQTPAKPAKPAAIAKPKPTKPAKAKSVRKAKTTRIKIAPVAPRPTPPAVPATTKTPPAVASSAPPVPMTASPRPVEGKVVPSAPVADTSTTTPATAPTISPGGPSGVPTAVNSGVPPKTPPPTSEPARGSAREAAAPPASKTSPLSSMTGLGLILGLALLLTALGGLFLRRRQRQTRVTSHEPVPPPVSAVTAAGTIISAARVKEQLYGERSATTMAPGVTVVPSPRPTAPPREESPVTVEPPEESGADPQPWRQPAIEALYNDVRQADPSSTTVSPEPPAIGFEAPGGSNPPVDDSENGLLAPEVFATTGVTEASAPEESSTTADEVVERYSFSEAISEAATTEPEIFENPATLPANAKETSFEPAEGTSTFEAWGDDLPTWSPTIPVAHGTSAAAAAVVTTEPTATFDTWNDDLPIDSAVATAETTATLEPWGDDLPTWSPTEAEFSRAFSVETLEKPTTPDILGDLGESTTPDLAPTNAAVFEAPLVSDPTAPFSVEGIETAGVEPRWFDSEAQPTASAEPIPVAPHDDRREMETVMPTSVFEHFAKVDLTPDPSEGMQDLPIFNENPETPSRPGTHVIPFVETVDYKTFFNSEEKPITRESLAPSSTSGKTTNRSRAGKMALRIQGELGPAQAPALLKLISGQRKAGELMVFTPLDEKHIYFNKGKIAAVRTINPGQQAKAGFLLNKLGDLLLRQELITPQQRDRALEICALQPLRRVGEVLLETTQLTPEELQKSLRIQAEEILFSLLLFPLGSFEYASTKNQISAEEDLAMEVTDLLRKAALQLDEWRELRKAIPSLTTVMEFKGDSRTKLQHARMTPPQEMVLSLVDGRRTVQEICQQTGILELEICKFLLLMTKGRILQPVKAE